MTLLAPILAFALTLAPPPGGPAAAAPAKAVRQPAAPEVRVQGYRIIVEKLVQSQTLALDFPDGEEPGAIPATGRLTGNQQLSAWIAVQPPNPKLAANIEGLDPKLLAFTGRNTPVNLVARPVDDHDPLRTGVWRTILYSQDVGLSVSRVNRLQGELIVYPEAKVVTLEFPLPLKGPVTREAAGYRATVRPAKARPGSLAVQVETSWPSSLNVVRVNPESASGVAAITHAGTALTPNGTFSSPAAQGGRTHRLFAAVFPEVREMPARLRVQALVRSGAPKRLAFTLPEIALPDTLGAEAERDDGFGAEPFTAGHPLFDPKGGALHLTVRGGTAGGRLLVGLSRRGGAVHGPWRWVETTVDAEGRVVLPHLKPGSYRVARAWAAGGAPAPLRLGGVVDVELAPGKATALEPVEAGGQP